MKRITLAVGLLLFAFGVQAKSMPLAHQSLAHVMSQPWMKSLKPFFSGTVAVSSSITGICVTGIQGLTNISVSLPACAGDYNTGTYTTNEGYLQVTTTGSGTAELYVYADGEIFSIQTYTGAGTYNFNLAGMDPNSSIAVSVEPVATKAIDIINLTTRGYCITGISGLTGFDLPTSVCAGESYYTDFATNTGAITVYVSGFSATEAQITVSANGTPIQTQQVNAAGSFTFNLSSYVFANLEVMIEPG